MSKYQDLDLDLFDVIMYFDERGIHYNHAGSKNTSAGWISISCPFCGDRSTHLGVSLESKLFSCFRCGAKGGPTKLIMAIEECSISKAFRIIESFVLRDFSSIKRKERIHADTTMFPSGISEQFLPMQDRFIQKRRYDREFLHRKYDIMAMGPTLDDWKFRIIIPVYMNQEVVTYVGRDVTGKLETPYKNAPITKSIVPAKETLYNIDTVKDTAIIVEGILDSWRIGISAVATFGTQFTSDQIALLAKKKLKKAVVLFDADASVEAEKLAHAVGSVCSDVSIITLDEGDPDDLTEDEVFELRREIFSY